MYKGIITTPIAVAANTDIPFNTILNTNIKTIPENGAVNILSAGYWNVRTQINFTGATGDIEVRFFNDGVEIPDTVWTFSAAPSDVITATLEDVLKVVRTYAINLAKISVRISSVATVNTGIFVIDEIK